ncbi:hypothetical protein TNCV_417501 [Trichonephila clavipes]|nr:hypothetical protein TNCV_417501 [Trichonephila clavipes]
MLPEPVRQVGLLHDRWRHYLSPPPQFRRITINLVPKDIANSKKAFGKDINFNISEISLTDSSNATPKSKNFSAPYCPKTFPLSFDFDFNIYSPPLEYNLTEKVEIDFGNLKVNKALGIDLID